MGRGSQLDYGIISRGQVANGRSTRCAKPWLPIRRKRPELDRLVSELLGAHLGRRSKRFARRVIRILRVWGDVS